MSAFGTQRAPVDTRAYASHPLDPATVEELEAAVRIIRLAYPDQKLHFKSGCIQEPPKAKLQALLRCERAGTLEQAPYIPREIHVVFLFHRTPRLFDAVVNLTEGTVTRCTEQPRSFHAPLDRSESVEVAIECLSSPLVHAELKRLGVNIKNVSVEPWMFCRDNESENRRLMQIFFYLRNPENNDPDSNHFAFPLDFMAICDMMNVKVLEICHLPVGPEKLSTMHTGSVNVGRPAEPEYVHSLQKNKPRATLKPLQVIQPEGASFTVHGNLVEWEKWRFRVGFNYRDGLTLHDVTYDGRELFYRLSVAELFVPYGDPRDPLHRKAAFDMGDVGAGLAANDLQLGCDCLGVIHYFDGAVLGRDGEGIPKNNAICMHEVDSGLQWKHSNLLTGTAVAVRKRQLQLQTILTLTNYEYVFYWTFDQAGELELETRPTGIVNTMPIDPKCNDRVPFATRVGDGVLAPYHQHLFCMRIDPSIDGDGNSVQVTDAVPMPLDKELNPYGTGYTTEATTVKTSTSLETDSSKGRSFTMINPSKINSVSRTPVGYKLGAVSSQMLLAHPTSWHARRAEYAQAPLWVTKYRDDELYPAGQFTNQSRGGHGVKQWAARKDNVENDDIVLWHTFAFQHVPRVEDFPVMPVESMRIALRPTNFFDYNPAIDVPPSSQAINKSVLHKSEPVAASALHCEKM